MAASAFKVQASFLRNMLNGNIDLDTATLAAMAVVPGHNAATDGFSLVTSFTAGVTITLETAVLLANVTLTYTTGSKLQFKCDDFTMTSSAATKDWKYVYLYHQTSNYIIGYFDTFDGDSSGLDGKILKVTVPGGGMFNYVQS